MDNIEDVPRLTEHLFRHESGKLVSMLTGIFGLERLQLAEDAVQEALVRAFQTWPYDGVPRNPAAWLMQTAKHLALDVVRRDKVFYAKQAEVIATIELRLSDPSPGDAAMFDDEIKDKRLRLIFACCHPVLPVEAQTALALKTLCGFSPGEIAKSFLISEVAATKRLTRARQRIQEERAAFEIPSGAELPARLDGVLQVIYLLFNEGYKASSGETLVRSDLCFEAIRLGTLLAAHPSVSQPRVYALLALMLLNAARLPSRADANGNILRLEEQDRSAWDPVLIGRGIYCLGKAATGGELSEYHLQAGIAACHCTATDFASTDWTRILGHYDYWTKLNPSPVVALNRAVAVAKVHGPAAGLAAVDAILDRTPLEAYHLTHAVLGEFHQELRRFSSAAEHFRKALALTEARSEQAFLAKRLEACKAQAGMALRASP